MEMRDARRWEFRAKEWSVLIAALLGFIAGAGMMLLAMSNAVASDSLATDQGRGDASENRMLVRPISDIANAGTDEMESPPNAWIRAPLVATAVELDVSGFIVRGTVRQVFKNESANWVEGIYKFPLPQDAAVDELTLKIADRVIKGVIDEKQAARKTYETAKSEGRASSLLEQERPNLFTISVANIPPGEIVEVSLGYQAQARRDGDRFELTMPLVAAPRYQPPIPLAGSNHPALRDIERQITAEHEAIDLPIESTGRRNPVGFLVRLATGVPLATLESPSHDLVVVQEADHRYEIQLRHGLVPADHDFVLRWRTERGAAPGTALFKEKLGLDTYLLLMMMPPNAETAAAADLPRDVTFIVDTSSSMHGAAMLAAKEALAHALERLTPSDRFDIVEFNDQMSRLFGAGRQANKGVVSAGLRFTARLEADGGTEMVPALASALADRPEDGMVRQVVFLTDGLVGNEDQLFDLIDRRLGQARLFTVGLGPAPNGWFMKKAASVGRGRNIQIATLDKAGTRLAEFYDSIALPVATNLAVGSELAEVESFPRHLPDLYGGEPVITVLRIEDPEEAGVEAITLMGTNGGEMWSHRLRLASADPAKGIAKLWARLKVDDLMDRKRRGRLSEDETRMAVLDVAIPHGITSSYTSLVAVDATPIRPDGEGITQAPIPGNKPHGWTDKNLGASSDNRRSFTPTPSSDMQTAMSALSVAQASVVRIGGPAGALGWQESLGIGLLLLVSGGVMVGVARAVRT